MASQRLWFLVGPTASGKSAAGIELAQRIDAEVLSLDSMAVYRGMDVGTAKPSPQDRARVPHHLLDLVEPHEAFSTGRYVEVAEAAIVEVRARGKRPLFVGGTALYLKALTEGFFEAPAADWELRNRLKAEAVAHSSAALHERLRGLDPAAAERIHPHDLRRIVRALEVYHLTGRPISEQQRRSTRPPPGRECLLAGLWWGREALHERIDRRVDAMFEAGLVDEVRRLLADPRGISHAASQFVGYREVIAALQGEHSLEEARRRTKTRTHRFARRQLTWFRKFPHIRWVEASAYSTTVDLADALAEALGLAQQGRPDR
ncbi:MAG: tRNA (adenosine(37)-N6)-dimethylallyltransferase MiaA [Candidatus Brocadiia bacterium]